MFITFEGIEGSGKSTALERVREHLEGAGREVLVTREPGGCRLGATLRKLLLDMSSRDIISEVELFLFLADRAQHVHEIIRPALDAGKVVLCDRYADSTVVYQGYGRGLDPVVLHSLNDLAVKGLWPEATFLLDLPAEVGLNRALARNVTTGRQTSEGRFEAESLDFHNSIREGYLTWASVNRTRFHVVDADRAPDEVANDVCRTVDKLLRGEEKKHA
ncbi:MAG: dTMP kinase [Desulfovibrionaceae bacterium]|jgi:dTMP kinase|nr:dTMP kinase [Desulfovibrionaceae bacterium]